VSGQLNALSRPENIFRATFPSMFTASLSIEVAEDDAAILS
jgi:hypothetical protein